MIAFIALGWVCLLVGFVLGTIWGTRPSAKQRRSRILPMDAKAPTSHHPRIVSGDDHG